MLILLLSLVGLEEFYDVLLSRNVDIKASYVLQDSINADILVVGSCEAFTVVNSSAMEEATGKTVYNLATNHSSLADQLLNLHLYLQKNKVPECLLLYLNPESFDLRFNKFNIQRFLHHSGDSIVKRVILEQNPKYRWLLKIPFFKYLENNRYHTYQAYEGFKDFVLKSKRPFMEKGYLFIYNDRELAKKAILKDYPDGITYQWDAAEVQYLEQLIFLAKRYGIRMVFFESPVWHRSVDVIANYEVAHQRIADCLAGYGLEYIRFNFLNGYDQDSAFINLYRLDEQQSERFSAEFGKWLISHNKVMNFN